MSLLTRLRLAGTDAVQLTSSSTPPSSPCHPSLRLSSRTRTSEHPRFLDFKTDFLQPEQPRPRANDLLP